MEKKKILVVDDETDFTQIIKFELEGTGKYLVKVENNGLLALDVAKEFKPDFIFMDVIMPGLDGPDIAPKIKAEEGLQDVPIVFLTSLLAHKETDGGVTMKGGFPFLAKGANSKELISCIEKYIG